MTQTFESQLAGEGKHPVSGLYSSAVVRAAPVTPMARGNQHLTVCEQGRGVEYARDLHVTRGREASGGGIEQFGTGDRLFTRVHAAGYEHHPIGEQSSGMFLAWCDHCRGDFEDQMGRRRNFRLTTCASVHSADDQQHERER